MRRRKQYIPTLRTSDDCRDWLDRNKSVPVVHRGDVWFARLERQRYSSVQEGIRPVLIISNDKSNRSSATVTVIPFTGQIKRTDLPTHVVIDRFSDSKEYEKSLALVEQVTTIDKRRLLEKMGSIKNRKELEEINQALRIHFSLEEKVKWRS